MQVHSGEKAVLYTSNDGQPVWIALEDGYLVPSLFTSWNAPFLMQRVCTVKYTLERLQNGADLMIPGIFDPLPDKAPPGTVVGICLIDSPTVPVAVGITLVDCSEGKLDTNQKGKAVQLINVIDDKLFQSYKKQVPIPKELNVEVPVVEVEEAIKELQLGTETEEEQKEVEPEPEEQEQEPEAPEASEAPEEPEEQTETDTDSALTDSAVDSAPTTQEIDDAFRRALLQTLRQSIDNPIETPIPSSTFLSNYILLNLPYNHPHIQMKKTSWKKASKFFKVMEKQSLLKGKERGGEFIITSLSGKNNPEVSTFAIFKPRPFEQHKQSGTSTPTSNKKNYLTAKEYFKPRSMTAPLFTFSNLNPSGYYTAESLRQVLMPYIDKNSLVDTRNPRNIRLDRTLTKAFGLSPTVETVGRDKLVTLLQANCSQFHSITSHNEEDLNRQTDPPLAKGPIPKINITSEKRAGRKVVTNITNIEPFHIDPVLFAEELRIACAGSTSVNPIREGSDLQQVMIQGNHITTITKTLENKGIRPAWIEIVDKAKR